MPSQTQTFVQPFFFSQVTAGYAKYPLTPKRTFREAFSQAGAFLSPNQECINTEGSRALTAIGDTVLIHYWTREERLASPFMKVLLFQYPCGNRYHFSTLINCFIDYCFVLYILLFESVENIAFAVKVAVKFMMADVCLCS